MYLYDKAISTVQINGSTGRGFRRTAGGVRQDVFFRSSFSTNFLQMILSGALEELCGKVSKDNRTITNLQFADDKLFPEEQRVVESLDESFDKNCKGIKLIYVLKRPNYQQPSPVVIEEIKVKGQKLGTVTSFKYLGEIVSDKSSKSEVLSSIEQSLQR